MKSMKKNGTAQPTTVSCAPTALSEAVLFAYRQNLLPEKFGFFLVAQRLNKHYFEKTY